MPTIGMEHYKLAYGDSIQRLAGHQDKTLLKQTVSMDAQTGKVALFDVIEPDDDADVTALASSTAIRREYEEISSPTLADWVNIQTPYMDVTKNKVLCSPYEIIWAYTFAKEDEVGQNATEESEILHAGMQKIAKEEDKQVLDALSRATEQRGEDPASAVAVAFPANQQINVSSGTMDTSVFSSVLQKFEDNYVEGEPIYMIISPSAKKSLIDNSGGTIHSSDFVDRKGGFERGTLPDIYGIHVIVHPRVTDYSGTYDDAFFAYCPTAIKYNQFDALTTQIDKAATQKFNTILQIQEYVGCCRMDDKKVVQGTLGTSS